MKTEYKVWGYSWLGLLMIRCHWGEQDDYKTFWHISLWKFTFGMSFPAFIVKWFEK